MALSCKNAPPSDLQARVAVGVGSMVLAVSLLIFRISDSRMDSQRGG